MSDNAEVLHQMELQQMAHQVQRLQDELDRRALHGSRLEETLQNCLDTERAMAISAHSRLSNLVSGAMLCRDSAVKNLAIETLMFYSKLESGSQIRKEFDNAEVVQMAVKNLKNSLLIT